MDSRLKEYCTCSRKLLVYGSIIPIYPALSKLENKFMENTNKYENRHFHDTNMEKDKDTLKVVRGLKNANTKLQTTCAGSYVNQGCELTFN